MLILVLILGLVTTKQIEFSNAFVQAELKEPVYLEYRGSQLNPQAKEEHVQTNQGFCNPKPMPPTCFEENNACIIALAKLR
jgi:hypothetical protein